MKIPVSKSNLLRKLKLMVLIVLTATLIQSCFSSLGGEEEMEEPDFICEGITNGFDSDVSQSDCLAVEREWVEGQGCYCGSGE